MAITTMDQVIAGMQEAEEFLKVGSTMEAAGVLHSLFYTSGQPGAASAPSSLNGAALTSYAGQIPFANPVSGNTHLALLEASATLTGTLLVCDRLWHNGSIGITTTTGQAITTPTWPARDKDGTTSGHGVMVGIEVSGACGNGAVSNTTLSYVNSTNTGGTRTATISSFPASAAAGTFVPFQLQAGDVGIRSVSALTLGTTYVSGTIHLVAYRVLARVGLLASKSEKRNVFDLGKARLYDNTVPFLLWRPSATTAVTVEGRIAWAQG